ncbi:MAG: hypothetical protein NZ580_08220, partial [Bacteroidia bacterium]|nr:hypothetical protein [Bacteroidia bacterium]
MRQIRNYWILWGALLALLFSGLMGCKKKEKDSPSGGGGGGGQTYAGLVKAQLNGRLIQFDIPAVLSWSDPPTVSLSGTAYAGQDTFTLVLQFRIPTSRSDTSYVVSGNERGAALQIQYRGRTNRDVYLAPYSARNRFARLNMESIQISGNQVQGRFSGTAYNP